METERIEIFGHGIKGRPSAERWSSREWNPKYLKPINGPKYYALKFAPSAYGSIGGIRINYKTEVVDKDNQVISGLYAAGTDANSICNPDYVFILPGNSLGFAVNSGRMAGENAVQFIKEHFSE